MDTRNADSAVRPRWSSQSRSLLITGATFTAVAAFTLSTAGYCQYVTFVPEFTPTFPAPPNPNGYAEAARLAARLPASHPLRVSEVRRLPVPTLRPLVLRVMPALFAVRRMFALSWQAPSPLDPSADTGPNPTEFSPYFCAASRLARLDHRPADALRWSVDAMELGSQNERGGNTQGGQSDQVAGMEQAERCVDAAPRACVAEELVRVRRLRLTWPRATDTLELFRLVARTRLTDALRTLSRKPLSEQLAEAEPSSPTNMTLNGGAADHLLHHSWAAWDNVLTPRTRSLAALDRHYELMKARARAPIREGYGKAPLTDHWAEPFGSNEMGCYRWEWPRHNLALLEAALAVRLFYLEHSRYPASLGEIEREHLPEVPVDVWDQPLRYRLRNGRPVIYSIGRDGIDDGGRAVDPDTLIQHGTGDAVWGKLCSSDWPRKR